MNDGVPEPVTTDPDVLEPVSSDGGGQRGQGMIEYAFILMLVALVLIIAVQVLGHQTDSLYSNVSNGLTRASGG